VGFDPVNTRKARGLPGTYKDEQNPVSEVKSGRYYVHYLGYLLKVMLSNAEFTTMAIVLSYFLCLYRNNSNIIQSGLPGLVSGWLRIVFI
jgi:hypothetical protein